jgi:hypothetical protein
MTNLPSEFFWVVGIMVVFNLSAIIAVWTATLKISWFLSRLDNRVENLEKNHGKDIDQAFVKIRDLEKQVNH